MSNKNMNLIIEGLQNNISESKVKKISKNGEDVYVVDDISKIDPKWYSEAPIGVELHIKFQDKSMGKFVYMKSADNYWMNEINDKYSGRFTDKGLLKDIEDAHNSVEVYYAEPRLK